MQFSLRIYGWQPKSDDSNNTNYHWHWFNSLKMTFMWRIWALVLQVLSLGDDRSLTDRRWKNLITNKRVPHNSLDSIFFFNLLFTVLCHNTSFFSLRNTFAPWKNALTLMNRKNPCASKTFIDLFVDPISKNGISYRILSNYFFILGQSWHISVLMAKC